MVTPLSRALKRAGAWLAAGAVTTTGLVVLTSSPALAAPVWCGSWLRYPSQANMYAVVANTEATLGYRSGNRRFYMRVLAGRYGGEWYAFAKEYNAGAYDLLSLIWVNRGNDGIYQCGDSNGNSVVAPGSYPTEAYTAGVDYSHARRVQTKQSGGADVYGPAANFYWPG